MNLILPVQTQGWYRGLSGVPSERHTRQISAIHKQKHTTVSILMNIWSSSPRVSKTDARASVTGCVCGVIYMHSNRGYLVKSNILKKYLHQQRGLCKQSTQQETDDITGKFWSFLRSPLLTALSPHANIVCFKTPFSPDFLTFTSQSTDRLHPAS